MVRLLMWGLLAAGFLLVPPQAARGHGHAEKPAIRLLVLKHSKEHMADGDADLAVQAARKAAGKGLAIKTVGNHYVNRDGKTQVMLLDFRYDLPRLRAFVSEQMKVDAAPGDTFMVFTIGHGMQSGNLQNLGQRADVLAALAGAAEENQQKTLWWQLSCHASAKLPAIDALPAGQQRLFSMVASSSASEESAANVQGRIMEKLFAAMADGRGVDANGDDIITAGELRDYFRANGQPGLAGRVFALSADEPVFGAAANYPNLIPVVDRNGPQGTYPKTYIPLPAGR